MEIMKKAVCIDHIVKAYEYSRSQEALDEPFQYLGRIQVLLSQFLLANHIHPDKQTMNTEFAPQYEEFEGLPFSDVKEGA